MKRYTRSHTLISPSLKITSKINLLKAKITHKKETDDTKIGNRIKTLINFNLNNNNQNPFRSGKKLFSGLNMTHPDYLAEYKTEKQKSDEQYEKNISNIAELLTSKFSRNDTREEMSLVYALKHREKRGFDIEKNKLIEIIRYILCKSQKNENDLLIMKTFFSRTDKIASLFLSLNSESLFIKLLAQLKFEEYKENNIIFKEGDKGEKLYITLKGYADILVQKEGRDGILTQLEYIKYLIVLYLYQEMGMFNKILFYNKSILELKESGILTLLMVFRFYKFYKDQDFFLVEKEIKYEEDSVCEFINNETSVKEFIYQKLDYPVEDSIHIFNYTPNIIKELYRFYESKISELSKTSTEKEKEKENEKDKEKDKEKEKEKVKEKEKEKEKEKLNELLNKSETQNAILHPTNFEQLNKYGESVKFKYDTKNIKTKRKLREEIFNKIYEIKEISKNIIYNDTPKNYIEKLKFDLIIREIRKNYLKNADRTFKLKEDKKYIRYLNYSEANSISQFQIFGELALNSRNKKRTATVITRTQSYFGVLDKKIYDSHLKVAQIKSRIRNILYFTEGPIFKGISPAVFLNEFFYSLHKIYINKGKFIFNKGDFRKKIYFVEKGEFELGCKMTLKQIGDIMKKLGGISDDKKEKYLCDSSYEFKHLYENKHINVKICILDNSYIIGLDDMCINDKIIFDCRCVSTDGADVYEFDYVKYKKALNEYDLMYKNNIEYVNKRRENFIKILFEQRNSLVEFEYIKIKEEKDRNEKLKEISYAKKYNILDTLMKDVKYNKSPLVTLIKNKNRKRNKNRLNENTNSIENKKNRQSSHEIDIKQIPSMSSIFRENKNKMVLNESESNSNFNNIMTSNNFYPMIRSGKIVKINFNNNNLNTINKFLEKRNSVENKNIRKKLYKIRFIGIKKKKLDFTDTNLLYNDKNKILKSLNIYINQSTSVEKRSRKNIIPFLTKYKLPLNKTKLKTMNKNKGYRIPSIFKECSKDFSLFKTKCESENDTLYRDYQKNIYNIFYPKHSKKFLELNEDETGEKFFVNMTENIKPNKERSLNRLYKEKLKKKDKGLCCNITKEKSRDKNDINYFDLNVGNNNKGIIDCLCFDNWAEKRQFEKNLLNYKIS